MALYQKKKSTYFFYLMQEDKWSLAFHSEFVSV